MPRRKKEVRDPFKEYDFDFASGVAYMFPLHWLDEQKSRFRGLPNGEKRRLCHENQHSFVHYNNEPFRVMSIPDDILRRLGF